MTPKETSNRVQIWERHGHSLMLALIIAGIIYMGNTSVESSKNQAAMAVEIKGLTNQVARLEGALSAISANNPTRSEFASLLHRVQALEGRR